MSLPQIAFPTYSLTIPSSKEKIKFRPFLVKEEKVLLMALESNEPAEMVQAIKTVLTQCVLTKDFDPDNLALFDIEYMFLQLRAKSVGEISELQANCAKCEATVDFSVDISKIKPKLTKKHSNEVLLKAPIGVILKYPDIDDVTKMESAEGKEVDALFNFIRDSIVAIYDDKQVYQAKDHTPEEMTTFVEGLGKDAYIKIQEFFETVPSLKHTVHYVCPACNHEDDIILEGLQSFF